jgi:hypothetical protein
MLQVGNVCCEQRVMVASIFYTMTSRGNYPVAGQVATTITPSQQGLSMPNDWTESLSPIRAMANIRREITGDWYLDPWGWPEYDYLLNGHLDWLIRRARATGVRYTAKIDVPKENFGIRPVTVMEPLDRFLYQGLVDTVSNELIGDLPGWVYGWRLPRGQSIRKNYLNQSREWSRYRGHLKNASISNPYGLKTDIISCFASIPIEKLCGYLEQKSGISHPAVTGRLVDMLGAFDRIPQRAGLPQRSTASSVLANLYLDRLHTVINDYGFAAPRPSFPAVTDELYSVPVARWMDDIWAFSDDEGWLRSFQVALQQALREIGLELNLGKTSMYGEEGLWAAAAKIEHSAVDAAIASDPSDIEPLEDLIDKLLASPEKADRTSIHFATTRIRRQLKCARRLHARVNQLADVSPRMPHAADHLARVFSDFKLWRSRAEWFLEYADGPWGEISWSVAKIGTMFPTAARPAVAVKDKFKEFITDENTEITLFALSAQRLSFWVPRQARDLFYGLIDEIDHPQGRRIIALASMQAGADKEFIRKALGEFEENQLTLEMLEDQSFFPISPVEDFGPGEGDLVNSLPPASLAKSSRGHVYDLIVSMSPARLS